MNMKCKNNMRLTIDGDMGEKDFILFAKFLRELWRNRSDNLCVFVEHGTEHMTSEECMDLVRRIFTMDDKDWKELGVSKEKYDEFREKMRK